MGTRQRLFLSGAVLSASVGLSTMAFADGLPTLAQPGAPEGWYTEGEAAFGGQVFITKPGDTAANSAAKFNEYGDRTDPLSLSSINFGVAKKDGTFRADLHGADVGADNQKLELDLQQPGVQYLTLGWYKTPQLRSNTAQSIFNGVGSTSLTVPDPVVQALYGALYPFGSAKTGAGFSNPAGSSPSATTVVNGLPVNASTGPNGPYTYAGQPYGCFLTSQASNAAVCNGKTPVQTTINNNEHTINLGIQRDRKEIDYRWTANEHWNIEVDYSNEHRFGVQEQGFLFSSSTSTPMAQVAAPIDDRTQDATISAEYAGQSPWGKNWNGMLRYNVSLYTDAFTAFTAENPFGGPGSPAGTGTLCPITNASYGPNCYGVGQMGAAPDNGSQSVMGQFGVDLPGFKSNRYMATLEYTQMTQNQAFIPMTINPGVTGSPGYYYYNKSTGTVQLAPLSRSSLDGQVDTTLFNNVLSTQLTSDLKNKLSYRYYDYFTDTPPLTLTNWVVNDTSIASANANSVGSGAYAPHTTLSQSYTKQNAADELTWSPLKWATVGEQTGWEQYRYSEFAANETKEYSEKLFGRINPTDWLSVRADGSYSWRRYNDYNWAAFLGDLGVASGAENPYLRDVDLANRNRTLGNLYADITTPISGSDHHADCGFALGRLSHRPLDSRRRRSAARSADRPRLEPRHRGRLDGQLQRLVCVVVHLREDRADDDRREHGQPVLRRLDGRGRQYADRRGELPDHPRSAVAEAERDLRVRQRRLERLARRRLPGCQCRQWSELRLGEPGQPGLPAGEHPVQPRRRDDDLQARSDLRGAVGQRRRGLPAAALPLGAQQRNQLAGQRFVPVHVLDAQLQHGGVQGHDLHGRRQPELQRSGDRREPDCEVVSRWVERNDQAFAECSLRTAAGRLAGRGRRDGDER